MTREQIIEIALAGFSKKFIDTIDLRLYDIFSLRDIHCLCRIGRGFEWPDKHILSIFIEGDYYLSFRVVDTGFNHYEAAKKMHQMGLVKIDFL